MEKINKILLLIIAASLVFVPSVLGALGDTTRVSVGSGGTEADGNSGSLSISSDGRYVAFQSNASNLVAGDSNGIHDIFVHDRNNGVTTRVSVGSGGTEADDNSINPSISADGHYVAFQSFAVNLVAGDSNGTYDIFVHDRNNGVTTRVSVGSGGTEADGASDEPSISVDGRYVAFRSFASNLVAGDSNIATDIFVHDRNTGVTTRISVDSGGTEADGGSDNPSISVDGRYVAFRSFASNLVPGDSNWRDDVFVHDRNNGVTTRVSVGSGGTEANGSSTNPSISADGRYVAFNSNASNLVAGDSNGIHDIFVHDRVSGSTTRVSVDSSGVQADAGSEYPSISADGRYVAFYSNASNLVPGDTNGTHDIFVHDRDTGVTTRVSVDSGGAEANGASSYSSISADGSYVAFRSLASNLVSGDSNGVTDIFVHEPDFTAPEITFASGAIPASDGETLSNGSNLLKVRFSENVLADGSQHAANAIVNYMLVRAGANGAFDTTLTSSAVCDAAHTPAGDDERIDISGITYTAATTTATLSIDSAFLPLADGQYRLYVCGEHSIWNLRRIPLNSGANMAINFRVGNATNTGTGSEPVNLPHTGFAPDSMTLLPPQDVNYTERQGLRLEIPQLQVELPIVGVPMADGEWDVTWLGDKAGWLEGSAYPTWKGNSVITGHVWNADNTPGVFSELHTLKWGGEVVVHLAGQDYIYEVRSVKTVSASNVNAMLSHEEAPWLTLVTCKGYDEDSGTYRARVLVRAVLKEIK